MLKSLSAYIERTARFLREETHHVKKNEAKKIHRSPGSPSLVHKIEEVAKLLRSKTN